MEVVSDSSEKNDRVLSNDIDKGQEGSHGVGRADCFLCVTRYKCGKREKNTLVDIHQSVF